jgi:hypothetical protein
MKRRSLPGLGAAGLLIADLNAQQRPNEAAELTGYGDFGLVALRARAVFDRAGNLLA